MRFYKSSLLAVAALVASVMGAENPIIYPDTSSVIEAGKPFTITWTPTTGGTVTFTLRQGPSDNLDTIGTIVANTENDGTYEWTPDASLPKGSDYAIMITDSAGNVNYTPLISIQSDAAPKSSSSSKAASSTSTKASSSTKAATSTKESSSTITSSPVTSIYSNTTTMITSVTSNSTISSTALYGNSTRTSTRSSTATPSETSEETSSPSATDSAVSTGAAAGLLKSPLALVVCLLGAVVYLN